MMKRSYHPYMRPLLWAFEKRSFVNQSKVLLAFLRETSLKNIKRIEDRDWIHIIQGRHSRSKDWIPKLYLCVLPKDYWSVVSDLILLSQRTKFNWKFCKNFKAFARPDKIVIYGRDLKDIKKILRQVRPQLRGKSFHKIQFASDTVTLGLEKGGEGIFVGADPRFLKDTSWRFYRWALEESVVKTNLKKGRMDRETKEALEKLNITIKHQGPRTLRPSKKNNAFIKKIWKDVIS